MCQSVVHVLVNFGTKTLVAPLKIFRGARTLQHLNPPNPYEHKKNSFFLLNFSNLISYLGYLFRITSHLLFLNLFLLNLLYFLVLLKKRSVYVYLGTEIVQYMQICVFQCGNYITTQIYLQIFFWNKQKCVLENRQLL